jgi:hypothetical protein
MVNIGELHRLLEVLALVRDLIKDFPADADLSAIRADLVQQIRALKP